MPQVADLLLKFLLLDREPTNEPVVDVCTDFICLSYPDFRLSVALRPTFNEAAATKDITRK